MDNKNNLDKKIEATLKANLNPISASDDLIFKTLARLEQEKQGTKVTAIPKKNRKLPIAIISSIAAAAIALVGVLLFMNAANNKAETAKVKSKKSVHMASVDSMEAPAVANMDAFAADSAEEASYEDVAEDSAIAVAYDSYSSTGSLISYSTYSSINDRLIGDTSSPSEFYFNGYYTDSYRYTFVYPVNNEILMNAHDDDTDMNKMVNKASSFCKAARK